MNNPVETNHRKRCRRFNEAGHAHALTFSCFGRQPLFAKDRSCIWMIEAIERARELHQFRLWSYVIMPEHVHLLIWPTRPDYSISKVLNSLKQSVSRKAIIYLRHHSPEFLRRLVDRQPDGSVSHRFWQRGGGYDRNLTEPKTIWATIDYLHANPVRRGLCKRPTDWEWVKCERVQCSRYRPAADRSGESSQNRERLTFDMPALLRDAGMAPGVLFARELQSVNDPLARSLASQKRQSMKTRESQSIHMSRVVISLADLAFGGHA